MVLRMACWLVLAVCVQASAQDTFTAKVIRVSDGDTVTVERENGDEVKVRFGGIDTPELAQRHGLTARAFVVDLIDGKNVRVELTGKRTFDRMVGEIFLDANGSTTDVSLELVKNGHAWWFWQVADEMRESREGDNQASQIVKPQPAVWTGAHHEKLQFHRLFGFSAATNIGLCTRAVVQAR